MKFWLVVNKVWTIGMMMLVKYCLLSGGQVIEYSFKCDDTFDEESCAGIISGDDPSPLTLNCATDEVIVATICVGWTLESTNASCMYSHRNCHEEVLGEHILIKELGDCLWKKNSCRLTAPVGILTPNACNASIYTPPDYVAAFNLYCVAASRVFNVCSEDPENITVSNMTEVAYIHSPQFPRKMTHPCGPSKCTCFKQFYFDDFMMFNFSIQHVDLEQNKDYVQIESTSKNGYAMGHGKNWTGELEHSETYSIVGYGFKISFNDEANSDRFGFLISFTATNVSEEDYQEKTSTSATTTEELTNPTQPKRTPLENTGIAMSVLFVITFCVLLVVILLYIRLRIQKETSSYNQSRANIPVSGATNGNVPQNSPSITV